MSLMRSRSREHRLAIEHLETIAASNHSGPSLRNGFSVDSMRGRLLHTTTPATLPSKRGLTTSTALQLFSSFAQCSIVLRSQARSRNEIQDPAISVAVCTHMSQIADLRFVRFTQSIPNCASETRNRASNAGTFQHFLASRFLHDDTIKHKHSSTEGLPTERTKTFFRSYLTPFLSSNLNISGR